MTTPAHTRAVAEVIERAAKRLHGYACKKARRLGGEEGIEWVRWSRLPEFAQDEYRKQARSLARAGLLATPAHDAQVLRDAAAEVETLSDRGDDGATFVGAPWLKSRADRIERQEGER